MNGHSKLLTSKIQRKVLNICVRKLDVKQCTEVRFASLLSGGFTTMTVINPLDRKLANPTSCVQSPSHTSSIRNIMQENYEATSIMELNVSYVLSKENINQSVGKIICSKIAH